MENEKDNTSVFGCLFSLLFSIFFILWYFWPSKKDEDEIASPAEILFGCACLSFLVLGFEWARRFFCQLGGC